MISTETLKAFKVNAEDFSKRLAAQNAEIDARSYENLRGNEGYWFSVSTLKDVFNAYSDYRVSRQWN